MTSTLSGAKANAIGSANTPSTTRSNGQWTKLRPSRLRTTSSFSKSRRRRVDFVITDRGNNRQSLDIGLSGTRRVSWNVFEFNRSVP